MILHAAYAIDFDGAFDDLLPWGIPPNGLHIDSLIVPLADATAFSFEQETPLLLLSHVSRTIAGAPYLVSNNHKQRFNRTDLNANFAVARDYFCSDESRDPDWCYRAFD